MDKADIMYVHYNPYNVYRQSYVHFLIQESIDEYTLIDTIARFPEDFNKKDCFGLTPIHYAVENRLYDLLRYFLNNGGNPLTSDFYGKTPLMIAQTLQFDEIALILKKYIKKKRILFKMRFIVKLIAIYLNSIESVWKPGGVGYLEAKNHFDSLL